MNKSRVENAEAKEQLFFSGAHRYATNLQAVFPDFRKWLRNEIADFATLLNNKEGKFPYKQLRDHTSHRCHRYKQLEKRIFKIFDVRYAKLTDKKSGV